MSLEYLATTPTKKEKILNLENFVVWRVDCYQKQNCSEFRNNWTYPGESGISFFFVCPLSVPGRSKVGPYCKKRKFEEKRDLNERRAKKTFLHFSTQENVSC